MSEVNLVFTKDPIDVKGKSVFLAGPTPRDEDVSSWRPQAIGLFRELAEIPLNIFVPEPDWEKGMTFPDVFKKYSYEEIPRWEQQAIEASDAILMWVPRDLKTMPAFTTNVEFGLYVKGGNLFYGRPDDAPKTRYLDFCYKKFTNRNPSTHLKALVINVLQEIQ